MVTFPFPLPKHKCFFLALHENLVGFLEVKSTRMWGLCKATASRSFLPQASPHPAPGNSSVTVLLIYQFMAPGASVPGKLNSSVIFCVFLSPDSVVTACPAAWILWRLQENSFKSLIFSLFRFFLIRTWVTTSKLFIYQNWSWKSPSMYFFTLNMYIIIYSLSWGHPSGSISWASLCDLSLWLLMLS